MTAFLDHYVDPVSGFTYEKASIVLSKIRKSHESDNAAESALQDEHQLQEHPTDMDTASVSVCCRNKCFTGIIIGLPVSLLLWAGIFSLISALF